MGLLRSLKDGWAFFKELQTIEKKAQEAKERWRNTTLEEAAALSDEELWACVTARLDDDALTAPGAKRTLHTAFLFDMEVQNGGLCQFFDNCPESAPLSGGRAGRAGGGALSGAVPRCCGQTER